MMVRVFTFRAVIVFHLFVSQVSIQSTLDYKSMLRMLNVFKEFDDFINNVGKNLIC